MSNYLDNNGFFEEREQRRQLNDQFLAQLEAPANQQAAADALAEFTRAEMRQPLPAGTALAEAQRQAFRAGRQLGRSSFVASIDAALRQMLNPLLGQPVTPATVQQAADSINGYTRATMREESVYRRIMPGTELSAEDQFAIEHGADARGVRADRIHLDPAADSPSYATVMNIAALDRIEIDFTIEPDPPVEFLPKRRMSVRKPKGESLEQPE